MVFTAEEMGVGAITESSIPSKKEVTVLNFQNPLSLLLRLSAVITVAVLFSLLKDIFDQIKTNAVIINKTDDKKILEFSFIIMCIIPHSYQFIN